MGRTHHEEPEPGQNLQGQFGLGLLAVLIVGLCIQVNDVRGRAGAIGVGIA